ncbi:hypothetical protein [Nocardioides sp. TF02-7]|uniref:hypothetical protein n=1 Tax=Nocardioides sp. TF02-7 TaxID=2917724 RepID=UPI001F05696A|nr:hypothetical protein [Nocardioides sp. TF02-7]UMG94608.1 hypothetical protein MF408_12035 [Nocardioides sp. TF02-7]
MSQAAPRPGQTTFAAWMIIGGSVILVITAWQRISGLHTLEVQDELQRVLSEPPVSGTGLTLESLKTTIRILCMVAAGAATASAILGFQALRRSTSARLALTLLAPLVLVGGFATAGFFAPLVVVGVVMLWLQPTRDWFAGRPWRSPAGATRPDPLAPHRQQRPDPFAPPTAQQARPPGPGEPARPEDREPEQPPAQPGPYGGAYGAPYAPPPATGTSAATPARRPGALIAACVTVWVTCALLSGLMLLSSLVMAVARDELFTELERQQPGLDLGGLSHGEIAAGVYATTALTVLWCTVAVVLAVLAFRRVPWARMALVICTGASGVVALAAAVVSPLVVVLVAAASMTFWLLLRSDVAAWFRR